MLYGISATLNPKHFSDHFVYANSGSDDIQPNVPAPDRPSSTH